LEVVVVVGADEEEVVVAVQGVEEAFCLVPEPNIES
jgi:hypothetical protein